MTKHKPMGKTLEEYLEKEINYTIYEHLKKHKVKNFKEHFDYYYQLIDLIEKDYKDPQACFESIIHRWEEKKLSYKTKFIYSDILYNLMTDKRYEPWQLKKIQTYFKSYKQKLISDKKKREGQEQWETTLNFIKSTFKKLEENQVKSDKEQRKRYEAFQKKLSYKLFVLPQQEEISTEIIRMIHKTLNDNNYIKINLAKFERHFIENEEELKPIEWLGRKPEFKAFVDLLINKCLIRSITSINAQIEKHFYSNELKTDSESFSYVTGEKLYEEITAYKETNHPISILFREIKDLLKESS